MLCPERQGLSAIVDSVNQDVWHQNHRVIWSSWLMFVNLNPELRERTWDAQIGTRKERAWGENSRATRIERQWDCYHDTGR